MSDRRIVTIDGNEAAAYVAHKTNEVCAIYPITPSSGMGEWADQFSAQGRTNLWGAIPKVAEMQSEAGAAAAVHGSLQAGALTTTFTASQGLLLMIPTMFKIAGELTPTVFHITARTIATHALSIFGDHSDISAVRSCGWGMLASNNVQEVMDMALIAQRCTLESRIPFVHFFDGFRTSHEVSKVTRLSDDEMNALLPDSLIAAHRARGMNPEKPVLRGTAQNPDVFFQAREACNPYYDKCADIVAKVMEEFGKVVGRHYKLFDYVGAPDAEKVIIQMASGADVTHEYIDWANDHGEKVGLIKVHLFRPFSAKHLLAAIPASVKQIAVLDRTKEPGALGEPLYMDVVSALMELQGDGLLPFAMPRVIGGRYGLSSKEYTPAMAKAVFDELGKEKPKNHFTVGIHDDVTNLSLAVDHAFSTEPPEVFRGMFYGLGADGTVGANKNSIKIIGEETDNFAQGYFVYDSKKSGSMTTSHLRFGPKHLRSSYLIDKANFIACHQGGFVEKFDMLANAVEGATFLLNTQAPADQVWGTLPRPVQHAIVDKKLKFYVIDAYKVAEETGMGQRVNTIMQTCFFAISGILPKDDAIAKIKGAIQKTYGMKGEKIVQKNFHAVDQTLAHLFEVPVPAGVTSTNELPPIVSDKAPDFVKNVTAEIIAGHGDAMPVSKFPVDGTFPTGTTQWEKRNIALSIPVWDESICIQCGKCAIVCPHASIRQKVYDPKELEGAPATFKAVDARGKDFAGKKYTLQVAAEDCTGCELCVHACPVKNKTETRLKAINMQPQMPLREAERENWDFFLNIPDTDRRELKLDSIKGSQFARPLFEFSGACTGCGETAYVKLVSQLFGDRLMVGNATGCSSIYGGNLPTTPWAVDKDGRGPTWNNSLFEDAAEFGFGFRLCVDAIEQHTKELLKQNAGALGDDLVQAILDCKQMTEAELIEQRGRVALVREKLATVDTPEAKRLLSNVDYLLRKSTWSMGGDGWAYDIGYGGLDHVLAQGLDHNILVMDTEVYSNTGGQMSKATPLGAVAKFAYGGKPTFKKDLGLMAISYGNVYVGRVAMGANDAHTIKTLLEAEAYRGPSIVIAYSHCIAHGIDMSQGLEHQKLIVDCGMWPLYRYNPMLMATGENPFKLDSKAPTVPVNAFMEKETRFAMLKKSKPEDAARFITLAQAQVERQWRFYTELEKLMGATMTPQSAIEQAEGATE